MNKEIDNILIDEYTQKDFFRNSIYNSFIISKNILHDFFMHYLFKLSPVSRYEYLCFIITLILSTIVLVSIFAIIYHIVPYSYKYLQILFYIYMFIVLNIGIRASSGRLISLKTYINSIDIIQNKNQKYASVESNIKDFFLSVKVYITASYIKMAFVSIYIINKFFIPAEESVDYITRFYEYPLVSLCVFILKIITLIYVIFMLSPSINSEEYLLSKKIPHYKISYYYMWYTKSGFVDNLTLLTGIFAVIATGHILIIGYALSLHVILSIAVFFQCIALMISGRFFSIVFSLLGFFILIISSIYLVKGGITYSFYQPETVIMFIKYYQIVTAILFMGVFHYISFSRDILKIISVLGFYVSALFIWEDSIAVKSIVMHDTQSLSVLFYGLLELFFFFIFLIRVANEKGFHKSEMHYFAKFWNDFRSLINLVQLTHIYLIMFIAGLILSLYSFMVLIMPFFVGDMDSFLNNHISILLFDFRKFVALYMLLSLYLLFKNYSDIFPMFIISFVAALEIYIIIYPSLSTLFPTINKYTFAYSYMYIYGLMFILSISLLKYNFLIGCGFSLSIIPFIFTLISILTHISYMNNYLIFNILFASLLLSNILISIGAYRQRIYAEYNGLKL